VSEIKKVVTSRTLHNVNDVCSNAFKACFHKFWQHQIVKFDFTADLTDTGNGPKVIKSY